MMAPGRPRTLRRFVVGVALTLLALTGAATYGISTSMRQGYPATDPGTPPVTRPVPSPVASGRLRVAVVAGASGSVATDVLAPYEVFARSRSFSVAIVAASSAPVVLSGGVHVLPDSTFADAAARPDVVVVPAVADPAGPREAPMRSWVAAQAARGAVILGVCAGSEVLAASGVLDGRRATTHWAVVSRLSRDYPNTRWVRGVRSVEDGAVVTTAGVTSGVAGALRVVERLAGSVEAERVGEAVAYPGWSRTGTGTLEPNRWTWADLPFALNAAFPGLRPMTALMVSDGVRETDLAAAADLYNGASFATRTVVVGPSSTVVTRHGLVLVTRDQRVAGAKPDRLVAPGVATLSEVDPALRRWAAEHGQPLVLPGRSAGVFAYDPILRDLAASADVATAVAAAKYSEYPVDSAALTGPVWPLRPTLLFVIVLATSALVARLTLAMIAALADRVRDARHGRPMGSASQLMTSGTAATGSPDRG